ncbi:hypothetical protein GCM10023196_074310 [Actinoallomurus vinaceus]|uniref:Uncharacterized protein n=1 Tax=Actinoallomurus vinaceus TaxID=1080074 RepID=A0ABP8UME7_9ACTN
MPTLQGKDGMALRRPSRRMLAIIGIVLVAVVGGAIGVSVVFAPPTPASTVQAYFHHLAEGDTAAAFKLVAHDAGDDLTGSPLLVPKAVADARTRPSHARILRTESRTASTGQEIDVVQVSYKLGHETVTQSIMVTRASGGGSTYLLQSPFLVIGLQSVAGRPVTINGIDVGSDDSDELYAFPGVYTATARGGALIDGSTRSGVIDSGEVTGQPIITFDFAAPTLAPGADAAVQTKVKEHIDVCARSTEDSPDNCPFSVYIFGSELSVKWSITTYPTVAVTPGYDPSSGQHVDFSSQTDGVAHYVATYSDYDGKKQTETGDRSFSVQGSAAASSNDITVNFGW